MDAKIPGIGEWNVDIVMCIDGTGSMAPIIDKVKATALNFHKLIEDRMHEEGKPVVELRVKVIVFREYGYDAEPMMESGFFKLKGKDGDDEEKYKEYVNSIEAKGGGDGPHNALEAVALALKSDWTTGGTRQRHVIVMFTNAPALRLGERSGTPEGLPKDIEELHDWWEIDNSFDGKYKPNAGRFVAFVPKAWPWSEEIFWKWSGYYPVFSAVGMEIEDIDMKLAILTIVAGGKG